MINSIIIFFILYKYINLISLNKRKNNIKLTINIFLLLLLMYTKL